MDKVDKEFRKPIDMSKGLTQLLSAIKDGNLSGPGLGFVTICTCGKCDKGSNNKEQSKEDVVKQCDNGSAVDGKDGLSKDVKENDEDELWEVLTTSDYKDEAGDIWYTIIPELYGKLMMARYILCFMNIKSVLSSRLRNVFISDLLSGNIGRQPVVLKKSSVGEVIENVLRKEIIDIEQFQTLLLLHARWKRDKCVSNNFDEEKLIKMMNTYVITFVILVRLHQESAQFNDDIRCMNEMIDVAQHLMNHRVKLLGQLEIKQTKKNHEVVANRLFRACGEYLKYLKEMYNASNRVKAIKSS